MYNIKSPPLAHTHSFAHPHTISSRHSLPVAHRLLCMWVCATNDQTFHDHIWQCSNWIPRKMKKKQLTAQGRRRNVRNNKAKCNIAVWLLLCCSKHSLTHSHIHISPAKLWLDTTRNTNFCLFGAFIRQRQGHIRRRQCRRRRQRPMTMTAHSIEMVVRCTSPLSFCVCLECLPRHKTRIK